MSPDEHSERLTRIENRLDRLELRSGIASTVKTTRAVPDTPAPMLEPIPSQDRESDKPSDLVTNVLGWGGALALVLAASYLVRLAIDNGWLTPARQISVAVIGGLALVGVGAALRERERQYASLLPAAGIVVLFLSVYGGHLYHGLFPATTAAIAVLVICAASIVLSRMFDSDLYALFAVAGSYSAPFLLSSWRGSITDVAIYFSAWGVVFSAFAILRGRRLIYLVALYLALIGFDSLWRARAPDQWITALLFQTAQFVIFGVATAAFSIRRHAPLDRSTALAHLPALLLFYFLQYAILDRSVPDLAPWVAVASLAAVAVFYGGARSVLKRPLPGGEFLLWSYVALVLFHAGYVESVPERWAPWFGFIIAPVVAALTLRDAEGARERWPVLVSAGIIFVANYGRVILDLHIESVPGGALLPVAYAVLLYAGYTLSHGRESFRRFSTLSLYMGHISLMAGAIHILDEGIVQSAAWGVLALTCLTLSLWRRDLALAQSSLVVFGLTAAKVLLYDLSSAPSIVRIVSLVVLGISFYVAGLLYQRTIGATSERWT